MGETCAASTACLIAVPCTVIALVAVLSIREVPLRTTIERAAEGTQVD